MSCTKTIDGDGDGDGACDVAVESDDTHALHATSNEATTTNSIIVYQSMKDVTRALALLAGRTIKCIRFRLPDDQQESVRNGNGSSCSGNTVSISTSTSTTYYSDSIRVLTLCLDTLGAALAWLTDNSSNNSNIGTGDECESGSGRALRAFLGTETPLINICMDILQQSAEEKRRRVTRRKKASSADFSGSRGADGSLSTSSVCESASESASLPIPTGRSTVDEKCFSVTYGDLIKAALCVVGNLSIQCPVVQETIRISGVLSLVLSHCATDFDNPLEREWALLCVRNACEGCVANQEFISSLQPQGVIQDETLKERGISVNFNASTGKFTIDQDQG